MSKKEDIINETVRLFSQYGYNLSLSQVAKAIGLKKQSIYNYFSSKDELIKEMLQIGIEDYQKDLKKCIEMGKDKNPKERLFRIMEFIVEFFGDVDKLKIRRWVPLLCTNDSIKEIDSLIQSYEKQLRMNIINIIQEGMECDMIIKGDIEIKADFYLIMIRGIVDGIFSVNNTSDNKEKLNNMFNEYWKMISDKNN